MPHYELYRMPDDSRQQTSTISHVHVHCAVHASANWDVILSVRQYLYGSGSGTFRWGPFCFMSNVYRRPSPNTGTHSLIAVYLVPLVLIWFNSSSTIDAMSQAERSQPIALVPLYGMVPIAHYAAPYIHSFIRWMACWILFTVNHDIDIDIKPHRLDNRRIADVFHSLVFVAFVAPQYYSLRSFLHFSFIFTF